MPLSRTWFAIGLCLAVATAFAVSSVLARVAFDAGSNPLSVNLARVAFAAVTLGVLLRWQGKGIRLAPARRWRALALGVLLATYSYCMYAAIAYLPVALVVLIFYLFPLLTGITAWAMGDHRPSWRWAGALGLAFVGLALALDIGGQDLDRYGLALAFVAPALFTVLLVVNARLVGGGDSRPVTLHMLASAFVVYAIACPFASGFALPETGAGLLAFALMPLIYAFCFVGFFAAVSLLGPVRMSMFMNFEPVASMILGYAMLGQAMTAVQVLGAALVIAAIVMARRVGQQPASPSKPS